jgi:hypothetical protein
MPKTAKAATALNLCPRLMLFSFSVVKVSRLATLVIKMSLARGSLASPLAALVLLTGPLI